MPVIAFLLFPLPRPFSGRPNHNMWIGAARPTLAFRAFPGVPESHPTLQLRIFTTVSQVTKNLSNRKKILRNPRQFQSGGVQRAPPIHRGSPSARTTPFAALSSLVFPLHAASCIATHWSSAMARSRLPRVARRGRTRHAESPQSRQATFTVARLCRVDFPSPKPPGSWRLTTRGAHEARSARRP